jgi:hypothetical protein
VGIRLKEGERLLGVAVDVLRAAFEEFHAGAVPFGPSLPKTRNDWK